VRSIRQVEVPAAVREFADAMPAGGEPAALTDARAIVRSAIASRPSIYVCGGWARVLVAPGASAWTLGRRILVRASQWGREGTDLLVAHELVHVTQWVERGRLSFLASYLGAYLRSRLRGRGHWAAYREIPAEVAAYEIEAVVEPYL